MTSKPAHSAEDLSHGSPLNGHRKTQAPGAPPARSSQLPLALPLTNLDGISSTSRRQSASRLAIQSANLGPGAAPSIGGGSGGGLSSSTPGAGGAAGSGAGAGAGASGGGFNLHLNLSSSAGGGAFNGNSSSGLPVFSSSASSESAAAVLAAAVAAAGLSVGTLRIDLLGAQLIATAPPLASNGALVSVSVRVAHGAVLRSLPAAAPNPRWNDSFYVALPSSRSPIELSLNNHAFREPVVASSQVRLDDVHPGDGELEVVVPMRGGDHGSVVASVRLRLRFHPAAVATGSSMQHKSTATADGAAGGGAVESSVDSSRSIMSADLQRLERIVLSEPFFVVADLVCAGLEPDLYDRFAAALATVLSVRGVLLPSVQSIMTAEVMRTKSQALLFRQDVLSTKLIKFYAQRSCSAFLVATIGPLITEILAQPNVSYEVNPQRLEPGESAMQNFRALHGYCTRFLDSIFSAASLLSPFFVELSHHMQMILRNIHSESLHTSLAGLIFLRYICAAIVSPNEWGLCAATPPAKPRRLLILIAKVLQNLANDVYFGDKEPYMKDFNLVITGNQSRLHDFLDSILSLESDAPLSDGIPVGAVSNIAAPLSPRSGASSNAVTESRTLQPDSPLLGSRKTVATGAAVVAVVPSVPVSVNPIAELRVALMAIASFLQQYLGRLRAALMKSSSSSYVSEASDKSDSSSSTTEDSTMMRKELLSILNSIVPPVDFSLRSGAANRRVPVGRDGSPSPQPSPRLATTGSGIQAAAGLAATANIAEDLAVANRTVSADGLNALQLKIDGQEKTSRALQYRRMDPVESVRNVVRHANEFGSAHGMLQIRIERHVEGLAQYSTDLRHALALLCGSEKLLLTHAVDSKAFRQQVRMMVAEVGRRISLRKDGRADVSVERECLRPMFQVAKAPFLASDILGLTFSFLEIYGHFWRIVHVIESDDAVASLPLSSIDDDVGYVVYDLMLRLVVQFRIVLAGGASQALTALLAYWLSVLLEVVTLSLILRHYSHLRRFLVGSLRVLKRAQTCCIGVLFGLAHVGAVSAAEGVAADSSLSTLTDGLRAAAESDEAALSPADWRVAAALDSAPAASRPLTMMESLRSDPPIGVTLADVVSLLPMDVVSVVLGFVVQVDREIPPLLRTEIASRSHFHWSDGAAACFAVLRAPAVRVSAERILALRDRRPSMVKVLVALQENLSLFAALPCFSPHCPIVAALDTRSRLVAEFVMVARNALASADSCDLGLLHPFAWGIWRDLRADMLRFLCVSERILGADDADSAVFISWRNLCCAMTARLHVGCCRVAVLERVVM